MWGTTEGNTNILDLLTNTASQTVSSRERSIYQWDITRPKLPRECFTKSEVMFGEPQEECQPKAALPRIPLLKQGDRVILVRNHARELGVGSEGIVKRDCNSRYDSVAVDFVRSHDRFGETNSRPWNDGHDCQGWVDMRNGRYYGQWIEYCWLKKIDVVPDDDILLLI